MENDLSVYYINAKKRSAAADLGLQLQQLVRSQSASHLPPVILCIGTDRVTGDSLGPLVGSFLHAYGVDRYLPVYGTLEFPIHALNLEHVCRQIKKKHPRSLIVAVDASLGTKKHIGYITLGQGSLRPGAGVQKNLTAVGDIFITGIINTDKPEAQLALQNTRLCAVTSLASCIAQGIRQAVSPLELTAASRSAY